MQEIVSKRTLYTKTFDMGGGKRKLITSSAVLHYKEDPEGSFLDIDLNPVETKNGLVVNKAFYYFRAFTDRIGGVYRSKVQGQMTILLDKIDGIPVVNPNVNPIIEEGRIRWKDVVDGLDIELVFRPSGVEYYKIIKSVTAPHSLCWHCIESKDAFFKSFQKKSAKDTDGRKLQFTRLLQPERDFNKSRSYKAEESISKGKVSKIIDKRTRQRKWEQEELRYPIIVDADINESVVAGADDGRQTAYTTGTGSLISGSASSSTLRLGGRPVISYYGSTYYAFLNHLGVRFQGVDIPQGSTIDAATLKLYEKGTGYDGGKGKIYGHDVDDAPVFNFNNKLVDLPKTTASTSIDSSGEAGLRSYDVKTIVQEIVNRDNFASGNDVAFIGIGSFTETGTHTTTLAGGLAGFYAYEKGSNIPSLEVDYTETTDIKVTVAPFEATWSLSGSVDVSTPITAATFEAEFSLEGGDMTHIPRSSCSGTLTLINNLKVGGTLTLVNSLSKTVTSNLSLVLDILSKVEGTQTIRFDIEDRAKFGGTLSLVNNIMGADAGVSYGGFYFLKSHGL